MTDTRTKTRAAGLVALMFVLGVGLALLLSRCGEAEQAQTSPFPPETAATPGTFGDGTDGGDRARSSASGEAGAGAGEQAAGTELGETLVRDSYFPCRGINPEEARTRDAVEIDLLEKACRAISDGDGNPVPGIGGYDVVDGTIEVWGTEDAVAEALRKLQEQRLSARGTVVEPSTTTTTATTASTAAPTSGGGGGGTGGSTPGSGATRSSTGTD